MSSAGTCAWAFVFVSEHVRTCMAVVSALQVVARSCLPCPPDSGDVSSSGLWSLLNSGVLISLGDTVCDWLSRATKQHHTEPHRFLAAVRAVLQVTLKCSQSAAIVYSCGVHPVPIKKLVMIYKDGALISVWLYSLGSQLMIRPAQLKRYSYICFCAYLKDFFFFWSVNRGSCTFFHFTDSTVLV